MAIPNIAALTELYGGTLAWELTPTQPVFSYDGKRSQSNTGPYAFTANWTSASPSYADISYTVPSSESNRLLIFTAGSVNYYGQDRQEIGQTTNVPTYAGVAMTELTTENNWALSNDGIMRMWYLLNPATGTNNLRYTASNNYTSSYQRILNYEINTFYNVNQSNPFKIQLNDSFDANGFLCEGTYNYGHYNTTSPSTPVTKTFTCSPGDLMYDVMFFGSWVNTNDSTSWTSTTAGVDWTRHNFHSNYSMKWQSRYCSVPSSVSGGEAKMDFLPSSFSSSQWSYNYHSSRGVTMQAADATTLFTVPTGYVVKVNQIYAGSTSAGLAMSAQVKSLAASGGSPATLRNAADTADLITAVDNGSVGNVASGITIVPGQQTKLLTQPIWLQENNQLAAMVGFGQGEMKSATEMKPAPTATCTVSMEIIKT